jgi:hypothetical protein
MAARATSVRRRLEAGLEGSDGNDGQRPDPALRFSCALAGAEAGQERVGQEIDRVAIGAGVGHGQISSSPPGRLDRVFFRRSNARACKRPVGAF